MELAVDFELILLLGRSCVIGSGAHILSTVQWGDGGQEQQRSILQDGHSGLLTCQFLAITQPSNHWLRET